MADFSGQALGFMLQVGDQATPVLAKAEKAYVAVSRAMESTSKVAQKTSSKTSAGMALLAGSLESTATQTKAASSALDYFVKNHTKAQRLKPIQAKVTYAGDAAKSAKSGQEIRMKALYPRGQQDPHFKHSNLAAIYKNVPTPPDYMLRMPMMAEGGIVNEATMAVLGEAGPEVVIPLDKLEPIMADIVSKTAAFGSIGAAKEADKILGYVAAVRDGSMEVEDRWDALYSLQAQLLGLEPKVRKAAKSTGQNYRLLSDQLGITTNSTRLYQAAMEKATEENNDFTSSGLSLTGFLGNVKGALMDAVTQSGLFTTALGAAAFAMAYTMDSAMFEVRQQMTMSDEAFVEFEKAGSGAMTEFGTSIEETTAILKAAAFNKLSGKDMKDFVKTAAMATQALDGMGVSSEDTMDLLWNGLHKVGVKGKSAGKVISGMAAAAKLGNVAFTDLAASIKENSQNFELITARGGDATKAMLGMSAVAAVMGNNWIEAAGDAEFFGKALDRSEWDSQMGAIAAASGTSMMEFEKMAKAGDKVGVSIARAQAALNIPKSYLDNPALLAERYGMTAEEVLKFQHMSKLSTEEMAAGMTQAEKLTKTFRDMEEQVVQGAADQKVLKEAWTAFSTTLQHAWDRISTKLIPVLWELGKPMLWVATAVLVPLVWGLEMMVGLFNLLPGPVKVVIGAVLGLSMAVAAYTAVAQLGVVTTIAKAAADSAMAVSEGIATVATWALTTATWALTSPLMAIILPIAAVVGGIGLLVYGFMEGVTWAKWLGAALLTVLGPIGWVAAAAIILYDTLFSGGDMLTDLFDTMAGGMEYAADAVNRAVDWVVGAIEGLPATIENYIGQIPDLIAGIFEGKAGGSKIGAAMGRMFDAGLKLVFALFVKLPYALNKMLLGGILNVMGKVALAVYDAGQSIFDAITWPFKKGWEFISSLWSSDGNLFTTFKDGIWNFLKGMVNSLFVDPINSWVSALNAVLDYVPGLGANEVGMMARLEEGGMTTASGMAMLHRGEAIIPLDDARAVGEFAAATAEAGAYGGGGEEITINMKQDKVEALLTEIRDAIIGKGNQPSPIALGPRGVLTKKASSWEM